MKNEQKKEIRYADLFGGVGGFRLGIERAFNNHSLPSKKRGGQAIAQEESESRRKRASAEEGRNSVLRRYKKQPGNRTAKCDFYCEIDKYCVQIYNKRFNENWKPADITKVPTEDIPDFDLLCAGFPCQAFSIAGKRRGFRDARGTLFFEIARIIKAKKPSYLLLENVKGLLNHEKGQTFRVIIKTLSELGYDVQWVALNSKFFGVPQNRERVFIIGNLGGKPRPKILPIGEDNPEFQEKIGRGKDKPKISGALTAQYYKQSANSTYIKRIQIDVSGKGYNSQQDRFYHTSGVMGCLPNANPANKVNIYDKAQIRRLTPTECERLQAFPDNWTDGVSDTQRYKMMGNSVTVNAIEAVIKNWFRL